MCFAKYLSQKSFCHLETMIKYHTNVAFYFRDRSIQVSIKFKSDYAENKAIMEIKIF